MELKCSMSSQTAQCNDYVMPKNEHNKDPRRHKDYIAVRNMITDLSFQDTLHKKATGITPCCEKFCRGSSMFPETLANLDLNWRSQEELLVQAKDFIDQYFTSIKRNGTPAHEARWLEVTSAISQTGTYELTRNELVFGAKTAWRNAARCIGRIQWNKLQVFDSRHIVNASGMFEAICNHLKYATNKGKIRSAMTIFPQRSLPGKDYRIWNSQLVRYAGYVQNDGSIIGDPANVKFTEICQQLGWKAKNGMFDVLPLILQAGGGEPELFVYPESCVMEIPIEHPTFVSLKHLNLKWYGLPAVCNMMLDVGGLQFTAIPFNGWYMSTEVACRNFCDENRYNLLKPVAENLGFDSNSSISLWRDKVALELNIAVLHSYQKHGVTLMDHISASESFLKFMTQEYRIRGGCPADWVWIVPPLSGALTAVFHQEMLNYKLRPSYEYMSDPWLNYKLKARQLTADAKIKKEARCRKQVSFRQVIRAVRLTASLMNDAMKKRVKCTILYATETGRSSKFAEMLFNIFKHAFDARVFSMDEYDVIDLEHEALVLVVTSTFGNGEPPDSALAFTKHVYTLLHPTDENPSIENSTYARPIMNMTCFSDAAKSVPRQQTLPTDQATGAKYGRQVTDEAVGELSNVRFSVFALGNSSYPKFCSYGRLVDSSLGKLGGERIAARGEGDELSGQEESFKQWAQEVFLNAVDTFCIDVDTKEALKVLSLEDNSWSLTKFRLRMLDADEYCPESSDANASIIAGLGQIHKRKMASCLFKSKQELQSADSSRSTILIVLDITCQAAQADLWFEAGDHLAICAPNRTDIVNNVLQRVILTDDIHKIALVEQRVEKKSVLEDLNVWTAVKRFPPCSLHTALTYFVDLTDIPTQKFISYCVNLTNDETELQTLKSLAQNVSIYEKWKASEQLDIGRFLAAFPGLSIPITLLLNQLPLIQPRYYSISSSPKQHPKELHLTVGVIRYMTEGNNPHTRHGLCSSWLNQLASNALVPCFIRQAHYFRLPKDDGNSVIMIGPGTGIAPFRSFWQEIHYQREVNHKRFVNNVHLYFGCRNRQVDNLYAEEVESMIAAGVITNYYLALSREQDIAKTYVQDLVYRNGSHICKSLTESNCHFYICGDIQMAHDVGNCLVDILRQHLGYSVEQANQHILLMKDEGQLHEDIFGANFGLKKSTTAQLK